MRFFGIEEVNGLAWTGECQLPDLVSQFCGKCKEMAWLSHLDLWAVDAHVAIEQSFVIDCRHHVGTVFGICLGGFKTKVLGRALIRISR